MEPVPWVQGQEGTQTATPPHRWVSVDVISRFLSGWIGGVWWTNWRSGPRTHLLIYFVFSTTCFYIWPRCYVYYNVFNALCLCMNAVYVWMYYDKTHLSRPCQSDRGVGKLEESGGFGLGAAPTHARPASVDSLQVNNPRSTSKTLGETTDSLSASTRNRPRSPSSKCGDYLPFLIVGVSRMDAPMGGWLYFATPEHMCARTYRYVWLPRCENRFWCIVSICASWLRTQRRYNQRNFALQKWFLRVTLQLLWTKTSSTTCSRRRTARSEEQSNYLLHEKKCT